MKRTMGGAALLAALMAVAPMHVDAQMGPRGQRGMAMGPRGAGVEMLLRQKDRLELTEDQVTRLDRIRQESVERRTAHQAQMAELRSKVAAGQMQAQELRDQFRAQWESAQEVRDAERERAEAVLTDAQRKTLEEWGSQARAFQMGRQSALRGQGRGAHAWGGRQGMRGQFPQRGFRRGPGGGMGFGPPGDSIPK